MSKRVKQITSLVDRTKAYQLKEALDLVKKTATAKLNKSVDVAVNLGIDVKKSDQVVRGSVVLPRGTGKTVRVAVFTQGANVEAAKAAGADIVGFDDLAEKIKGGFMDFDVVIASPDAMRVALGARDRILRTVVEEHGGYVFSTAGDSFSAAFWTPGDAVAAAGLLAIMGLFDLVRTTPSGWLTDRVDPRKLLFAYYGLRGLSLIMGVQESAPDLQ